MDNKKKQAGGSRKAEQKLLYYYIHSKIKYHTSSIAHQAALLSEMILSTKMAK